MSGIVGDEEEESQCNNNKIVNKLKNEEIHNDNALHKTTPTIMNSEEDFAIPELPTGRKLSFILLSPWDDPFYMGLNTIEIFTKGGTRPNIATIDTDAKESFGDLRSLLYCKTCKTTDPRGMWMCKYRNCSSDLSCSSTQLPITITIIFEKIETIAMIRIWNYNESRVHALRGVCHMCIELDEKCIFKGEISCAFSVKTDEFSGRPMGDTILFTTNEEILDCIAENDVFLTENKCANNFEPDNNVPIDQTGKNELSDLDSLNIVDKDTTTAAITELPQNDENCAISFNINALAAIQRPTTGGSTFFSSSPSLNQQKSESNLFSFDKLSHDQTTITIERPNETPLAEKNESYTVTMDNQPVSNNRGGICGKVFHIELLANWGAQDLIGLTGIQFLGPNSAPISIENCVVRYTGHTGSSSANTNLSSLLRLINGKNLTDSPEEMWLHEWNPLEPAPMLSFNFAIDVCLAGVSIWNYNASSELSYCGVKCAQFYVNGRLMCGPVMLRRAPGYVYFDYVQDILFNRCHLFRPRSSRPNTRSISAFIFELRLLSSWGDEYYIGLNGVELYNRRNELIHLRPQNLAAFPESVNILPSMKNDPRSSDKLIDGVNDTKKPHHMWLTPQLPNNYVRIFFIFDAPVFISRIRIFNYRKTPERGVRHIVIAADDLITYSGEVPQYDSTTAGILDVSIRDLD